MLRFLVEFVLLFAPPASVLHPRDLAELNADLVHDGAVIELPRGELRLERPLIIPKSARNVTIRGNPLGSTIVMDAGFHGAAGIIAEGVTGLTLTGFAVRGNRTSLDSRWSLPPADKQFADYYAFNGILLRLCNRVALSQIHISNVPAYPVLVNASSSVAADAVRIEDSGTLNPKGRNNTTGGILFEEGVRDFAVRSSSFRNITGTAIWTHSSFRSPRNANGVISGNTITRVGRDAIQIGHAVNVEVERNRGSEIGFPYAQVDYETHGIGVALDTAGNVEKTTYHDNHFTAVNGQCINLDGFHDGRVTGNSCVNGSDAVSMPFLHAAIVLGNNAPGMTSSNIVISGNTVEGFAYGGVFLIGDHNLVENNRLLNLNLAHCGEKSVPAKCNYALDEPDLLRAGIYLSSNGGRPADTHSNTIRGNKVTGFGIREHCIAAAPGVSLASNNIAANHCSPN